MIDSNVPMYLVGAEHSHKHDATRLLQSVISRGERLVTDAEVLQEILHRYTAIRRPDAIQPAFDALLGVVDEVLPVDRHAVELAKDIVFGRPGISARDAIHLATMEIAEVHRIMSFNSDFDGHSGIERIS